MRLLSSAVLLAFALVVAPLSAAWAADAVFPRGSAIGLVPPSGMVEGQAFAGFEDRAHSASLLIVDMPPDAYEQIEAGFTDAALASKGITLEKREAFPIEGGKATLFTGTQTAGPATLRKWVLLVGTSQLTGLLTLQVPESEAAAYPDAAVRAAFATLKVRSVQDQVSALPFVATNLAGFRPVRALGGSALVLTDGPKDVIEGVEQPLFVVSVGMGAPRDDERRQFALRLLSTLPGVKDLKLERAEPQRISGQSGFEVMANGIDVKTGAPVKVVQWIRFGPTAYVRMVGVTRLDAFPDTYDRLRALRDGVEPR
ncbi:hypothetical protein K9U40_20420 [Xanthobacter autotrophicus]|uniref:hypothetical protein n=1 Tax=Xanthobacter TaxID=279 RepID=UPI0024AA7F59|nr:hypothetical protein [Xanthobacter autotrophicus]MDI4666667.1 hypothetical protein [Xanthobacter autotrophicus]